MSLIDAQRILKKDQRVGAAQRKGAAAAVVARDEGLRTSLSFVLAAYGLTVRAFDTIEGFLEWQRPAETILFVDLALLGRAYPDFIETLRGEGWNGNAILMVEDDPCWSLPDGAPEGCAVLVKPFTSEDVLNTIGMFATG